jgi:hypothetical protein
LKLPSGVITCSMLANSSVYLTGIRLHTRFNRLTDEQLRPDITAMRDWKLFMR